MLNTIKPSEAAIIDRNFELYETSSRILNALHCSHILCEQPQLQHIRVKAFRKEVLLESLDFCRFCDWTPWVPTGFQRHN